jgi:hypothetical protein
VADTQKASGVVSGAASGAAIGTQILPGWGTAIGAVVGGVAGFFGAGEDKPPPPPGYVSFDADGKPSGSMVWNASKNQYEYTAGQVSAEDKAYYGKINELRMGALGNLGKTPQDRLAAYDQYRQKISDLLHADTDVRYKEDVRASEETMNARGMFGSRAYADSMGLLSREKRAQDLNIANTAYLGAEDLAQRDINNWMGQTELAEGVNQNRRNFGLEKENLALAGVGRSQGGVNANWNQGMQGAQLYRKDQNQWNNMMTDTAGGLAYLYGLGGKSPSSTASPGVNLQGKGYSLGGDYKFS